MGATVLGWVRWLLFAVGVGCGSHDEGLRQDAVAYQAAVSGDPGACSRIVSSSLQAECVTFAAGHAAKTDLPGAQALCSRIGDPTWRDECAFWVCDSAEVPVRAAKRCCADAGHFANRCLGHAVSREVVGVLAQFGRGSEGEAWEAARDATVRALGPAGEDRAADLFIRYLADRTEGPHLRASDCGTAPEALCAGAYTELLTDVAASVDRAAPQLARPACAREVSVERATSLGLPGWDPEVHAAVQMALRRLCAR